MPVSQRKVKKFWNKFNMPFKCGGKIGGSESDESMEGHKDDGKSGNSKCGCICACVQMKMTYRDVKKIEEKPPPPPMWDDSSYEDHEELLALFQQRISDIDDFERNELAKAKTEAERRVLMLAVDEVRNNINSQVRMFEDVTYCLKSLAKLRTDQIEVYKKSSGFREQYHTSMMLMIRVGLGYNQAEMRNMRKLSDHMNQTEKMYFDFCQQLDDIQDQIMRHDELLKSYREDLKRCVKKCNEFHSKFRVTMSLDQFIQIGMPKLDQLPLVDCRTRLDRFYDTWKKFHEVTHAELDQWFVRLQDICMVFGVRVPVPVASKSSSKPSDEIENGNGNNDMPNLEAEEM